MLSVCSSSSNSDVTTFSHGIRRFYLSVGFRCSRLIGRDANSVSTRSRFAGFGSTFNCMRRVSLLSVFRNQFSGQGSSAGSSVNERSVEEVDFSVWSYKPALTSSIEASDSSESDEYSASSSELSDTSESENGGALETIPESYSEETVSVEPDHEKLSGKAGLASSNTTSSSNSDSSYQASITLSDVSVRTSYTSTSNSSGYSKASSTSTLSDDLSASDLSDTDEEASIATRSEPLYRGESEVVEVSQEAASPLDITKNDVRQKCLDKYVKSLNKKPIDFDRALYVYWSAGIEFDENFDDEKFNELVEGPLPRPLADAIKTAAHQCQLLEI